jgi:hypothetical protein
MGGCKKLSLFFGGFVCFGGRGPATLLLFL